MRVTKPLQLFSYLSLPFQLQTCADCNIPWSQARRRQICTVLLTAV